MDARGGEPKLRWFLKCKSHLLVLSNAQVSGDDCNKRKKHDEWGYASMFLHHISDLEMLVSKSGRQPFAQEAP